MFGKKKNKPQIDQEQLQLIQNAQRRIKQKKRFYTHFIVFAVIGLILYTFNVGLGLADAFTLATLPWSTVIIAFWFLLLFWHFLNVFLFQTFMGKEWEQKQLEKLVSKQEERIEKIKENLKNEAPIIAETQLYNESIAAKKQVITIIVAAAENDAIGKDNQLIWHLRDDLKRFKTLTSGHHIIMGRKTFESFPKPLPNRTHVVISRQENYQVPEGVIVVNSLDKAIAKAKSDMQPFIIGGGEIYKQAMPLADKIEITRVHEEFEADTFFPKIDTKIWKKINDSYHQKDENHKHDFSFLTYQRK
ncbi:dihydrofolate reductase [Lacinutrix sp. C3R15]|uniref:dihydrofolate reductase n=1 Tax=Flavobacteriaceae TaxID=49546 RepID=UPI001C0949D6|nr:MULTISPECIES: dihydrofolate reductase [Flavobacteriaceae]MBU2939996.1 dihydrofolate reductase [Lacinutrix sp. C3R15]MDO6623313.1 dihydrofolate reductase [Oceanihabitans sp. 1_MG-2023]